MEHTAKTNMITNTYPKTSLRFALGKTTLSINDLREKENSGEPLSAEERIALQNFERFRLAELNSLENDMAFHKRYQELQVMGRLGDFTEFLKDKYFRL